MRTRGPVQNWLRMSKWQQQSIKLRSRSFWVQGRVQLHRLQTHEASPAFRKELWYKQRIWKQIWTREVPTKEKLFLTGIVIRNREESPRMGGWGLRGRPDGVGGKPMSIEHSASTQASTIHSLNLAVLPIGIRGGCLFKKHAFCPVIFQPK